MLPARDHRITLAQKADFVANAYPENVESDGKPRAFLFHADQVKEMLSQPGAAALAVNKAKDADGNEVVVLTAKDDAGVELPLALELSLPCPPVCG